MIGRPTACFGVGRGFPCGCLLLELAVETSHALELPLNRHSSGVSNPATCVPTLVNQFFRWNPLLLLLLLFFSASNKAELNHFSFLALLRPPKHFLKPKSTSTNPSMINSIGSPTHTSASHADRNYASDIDRQPVSEEIIFSAGNYPSNSPVKFRGSLGLQDGNTSNPPADLKGGFYDSGKNIKFSFPTAYTITLLSWTVIEYHDKYDSIGELDHVKDIIRWGSDYLLKIFDPPNSTTAPIVGRNHTNGYNDVTCWQRPEDMNYMRPVSACNETASDLAGEIMAALSAASIVFKEDTGYSIKLIQSAEKLFEVATKNDTGHHQGTYTAVEDCGGEARMYYDSSVLVQQREKKQRHSKEFSIGTTSLLLMRLRYFHDLGYPYEVGLGSSSNKIDLLICSYLSHEIYSRTPGGLILLRPDHGEPLQFAATASFLGKLYSDYLELLRRSGVNYILGDNPMKMSYMVGFGNKYPNHVHHRAASIPWDDQHYSCPEGDRWLYSTDPNPNILFGAMVAGPDKFDNFLDDRDKPWFTEPTIASNAGLVAALIALHDPPCKSSDSNGTNRGIDLTGIFKNLQLHFCHVSLLRRIGGSLLVLCSARALKQTAEALMRVAEEEEARTTFVKIAMATAFGIKNTA
ncbi:hypothetical protein POTOM_019667 [Populus tomentosa]|uniref:Glycoside hydrolase family 9 domain-containing protein n=1 Tax=Populus tomentosa TaxID=118781 RepID=A0A8X7ZUZ9_POPTO|nr:hypothetical protein POTOM_019667 [Populus tomentosa]